jgi:hypothetical protein
MSLPTNETYMRLIECITSDVTLDDLTTAELMSLAALLLPAHTRLLTTGRDAADDPAAAGKFLRLVRDDDTSGAPPSWTAGLGDELQHGRRCVVRGGRPGPCPLARSHGANLPGGHDHAGGLCARRCPGGGRPASERTYRAGFRARAFGQPQCLTPWLQTTSRQSLCRRPRLLPQSWRGPKTKMGCIRPTGFSRLRGQGCAFRRTPLTANRTFYISGRVTTDDAPLTGPREDQPEIASARGPRPKTCTAADLPFSA